MTVNHVWAVETADLSLFRNPEFAINFESFFDLTIDQAAWCHHHAIAIADFNHKRAGRNQRRKIGVVELPEHSKIILIDYIEVKNVGSALRQIGRLDVPIVEVAARYDHLKTRFARTGPERRVAAVGESVEGETLRIDIGKRGQIVEYAAEFFPVHTGR